jgi:hypothetical protein
MESLETRCLAQSGRYPMEFISYFAISLLPGEPSVHALMFRHVRRGFPGIALRLAKKIREC